MNIDEEKIIKMQVIKKIIDVAEETDYDLAFQSVITFYDKHNRFKAITRKDIQMAKEAVNQIMRSVILNLKHEWGLEDDIR